MFDNKQKHKFMRITAEGTRRKKLHIPDITEFTEK